MGHFHWYTTFPNLPFSTSRSQPPVLNLPFSTSRSQPPSFFHGSLAFSDCGRFLAGVGKDERNRTLVVVWDISLAPLALRRSVRIPIVAKQISEFEVRRIRFSPYDPMQLVSCGRENIRFWRMKNGHLRGCPVILNEYARDTQFTDLAFESSYGPRPMEGMAQRHVFVATEAGTVVQVDYESKALECVFKLHDAAIHSIAINEGFCVTGSADRYLRVWPLDFSDFFLEAEHEGAVSSVDVSQDGLRLAIGTHDGTLGVLDVASHAYQTILRSHTDAVLALAVDPDPTRQEVRRAAYIPCVPVYPCTRVLYAVCAVCCILCVLHAVYCVC